MDVGLTVSCVNTLKEIMLALQTFLFFDFCVLANAALAADQGS